MRFNQGLCFEENGFSSTVVPHKLPPESNQELVNKYNDLEKVPGYILNSSDALIEGDWG